MFTLNSILARARTVATGMGLDPHQSPVIDNRPALRALANHAIRHVYKERAGDKNFLRDINVRHEVAITSGEGDLPSAILRQFLRQAEFEDEDSSPISYAEYGNRTSRYDQLGYVTVRGDSLFYDAPYEESYTGDLFVTAPSVPEFPTNPNAGFEMTDDVAEAVIYTLAMALVGKIELDIN